MNINEINGTFKSFEIEDDMNSDRQGGLYQLFSSIWGGTAGFVTDQMLTSRVMWPIRLVGVMIPINWLIFPFKLRENTLDVNKPLSEKISRIGYQELGKIISFSSVFLLHRFVDLGQDSLSSSTRLGIGAGVISLNLVSCYVLRNLTPASERIETIPTVQFVFNWIGRFRNRIFNFSAQNPSAHDIERENTKRAISEQIEITNISNQIIEEQINEIKMYILKDSELQNSFEDCINQTQAVLLSPPKIDHFQKFSDPLVDVWKQVMLKAHYLACIKTRIRDFLDNNSDFCKILLEKLSQERCNSDEKSFNWIVKTKGE